MQTAPTLGAAAQQWLREVRPTIALSTYEGYERQVRLHLGPLASGRLDTLRRRDVREHLVQMLHGGYGLRYTRSHLYVLTAILEVAVDAGLVFANVARGAGRKLLRRARETDGVRQALGREELRAFLAGVRAVRPRQFDYFLTLSRTGLRPGEALGLQWPDVDLARRQACITRTWSGGRVGPTKTRRARFIDLSVHCVRALTARRDREPETVWVFQSTQRRWPWDESHVQKGMRAGLATAGLPFCFHPHSLRHTYASLLIEAGWPIQYVQQQLGHASIAMTVDVYGAAWRARNLPAVDSLDDPAHLPCRPAPSS